jgi:hypothetical protein
MLSKNPNAIPLLEQHPSKIDWFYLSNNPNAIPLLQQHPDKIYWIMLCSNPSIFMDTYIEYARNHFKKEITREIMERIFHPKNIDKFIDWGFEE